MTTKKSLGQYYTEKNVFHVISFKKWWNENSIVEKALVLEPFAGSNKIIEHLKEIYEDIQYASFDIDPKNSNVAKNDSILNFPSGFQVCITNPPYLSKVQLGKKKVQSFHTIPFHFSDLYEVCLDLALKNCSYVAMILPASYLSSSLLGKDRLESVTLLESPSVFSDTSHPTLLALFTNSKTTDFDVYSNDTLLGSYSQLTSYSSKKKYVKVPWSSQSKDDDIIIHKLDNPTKKMSFYHSSEFIIKNQNFRTISSFCSPVKDSKKFVLYLQHYFIIH